MIEKSYVWTEQGAKNYEEYHLEKRPKIDGAVTASEREKIKEQIVAVEMLVEMGDVREQGGAPLTTKSCSRFFTRDKNNEVTPLQLAVHPGSQFPTALIHMLSPA